MAAGVTVFWAVAAAEIEAKAIPKIKTRRTCKSFTSLMMPRNSREWVLVITVLSAERKTVPT